ncbi:hypothetical protein LBMAG53_26030 [Planctomycetota bacterium]|nr:hypothetical protein LBMAG53_26030 [Planctomycetota bacterium]
MPVSITSDDFRHLHRADGIPVPVIATYGGLLAVLDGAPIPSEVITVPSGTPVIVLDDAATVLRIAITRGEHRCHQGWVPAVWALGKDQALSTIPNPRTKRLVQAA